LASSKELHDNFNVFFLADNTKLHSGDGSGQHEEETGKASSSTIQSGSGSSLNEDLVSKLTDAITARLEQKFQPTFPTWQFYETVEPTASSQVLPQKTTPPQNYSVPIEQSQLSDGFDAKVLIKLVPQIYKQKAQNLLQVIEERPNDITFDTNGSVFVNGESLPNSNIKVIFPALFKKSKKTVIGLSDVLAKLQQMNMLHLVNRSKTTALTGSGPKVMAKSNWWYLK